MCVIESDVASVEAVCECGVAYSLTCPVVGSGFEYTVLDGPYLGFVTHCVRVDVVYDVSSGFDLVLGLAFGGV